MGLLDKLMIEVWECTYLHIQGKGESFKAHLRCLAMAAIVYHVWEERDCRISRHESHDWNVLLQRIDESIRYATWDWKGQWNYQNWEVRKEWGLNDSKMLYNVEYGFCLSRFSVWSSVILF